MGTLLSGIAAWSFLTSFPFPKKWVETSEPFFKKSPIWYFAVAVSLGIVWMLMSKGLLWIFPPSLSSFLLVLFMIYTTGGLHLDGLADTFDGLGSRREKERALEILSDSRIGVFGVLALIACIGLKWLAVSHLITETSEGLQCGVLLSLPIVGRFCMLLHWNGIPPARTSGLAHFFEKRSIFLGLLLSFVGGVSLVYGVLSWKGLAVMAFASTGMIVFSWICWKKFGGYTGDTLGATCEISETLWLVGFTMTLEGIG